MHKSLVITRVQHTWFMGSNVIDENHQLRVLSTTPRNVV